MNQTNPTVYKESVSIHLGGQTRNLRFSHRALMVGGQMLAKLAGSPAVPSLRDALAFHRDVAVILVAASAGFLHEDKKATPYRIAAWLDSEPKKYAELEAAVMEAVELAYRAMGMLDEEDAKAKSEGNAQGEALASAPAAPTSTPGASSSEPQPASGSRGPASGG